MELDNFLSREGLELDNFGLGLELDKFIGLVGVGAKKSFEL